VQIVNREHPHFEEYGRFTGKIITMKFGRRTAMAEVKLENCRHGTDGCFVNPGDVRQVAERWTVMRSVNAADILPIGIATMT
jgi:hypothetical protein